MPKVRIEVVEKNTIKVTRLDYKRFEFYGFGSFMWNYSPKEISVSSEALELIKTRVGDPYSSMGDLAGLSFSHNTTQYNKKHNGYTLNYASLSFEIEVPIDDVVIDLASWDYLKNALIEDKIYHPQEDEVLRWTDFDKKNDAEQTTLINSFYNSRTES